MKGKRTTPFETFALPKPTTLYPYSRHNAASLFGLCCLLSFFLSFVRFFFLRVCSFEDEEDDDVNDDALSLCCGVVVFHSHGGWKKGGEEEGPEQDFNQIVSEDEKNEKIWTIVLEWDG